MSFGKGGGTTVTSAQPTPEQTAQTKATTDFLTGTVIPAYQQTIGGAKDVYNQNIEGVTNAAQNLAGKASQAQETLGGTGESALRTGISGLENLFSNDYAQQQINAAMAPAEAQYQQNIANQGAQFGGAGQLGSARQALAGQQLAGTTQALQAQTAAGILKDVQQGRLAAGQALTSAGQGGLGQALGAAGTQLTAAMTPSDLYSKYASVVFGTPASAYTGNFSGTQGSTATSNKTNFGISI
jgi:hypothetical protein